MVHRIVLASLLAALPACLNPDISDEYPVTMEAEALDVGDGGELDEPADDESADDEPADEDEPTDDDEPARDEGRPAPRRFTRGEGRASAQSSSLAAPAGNTRAR
jgi:hypothetical protein